jgi:hypothetical protein
MNKPLTREEIAGFIGETLYLASIPGSRCVDGRYLPDNNLPALARPGADAGYLMVAYAALRSLGVEADPDKITQAILSITGGESNFCLHTDSHAMHGTETKDLPAAGCGHFKLAKKDPESYGLASEDISAISQILSDLISKGARNTVLDGDHGEQAIIVVNSKTHSIKSSTPEGTQAFILQKTLDDERLLELAEKLSEIISGKEGVEKAVFEASEKQLQKTLASLAPDISPVVVEISENGIPKIV